MFGLGFSEILLILIVVLLLFGPDKLPKIARDLGSALRKLSKEINSFSSYSEEELKNMSKDDTVKKL
ncbi:MAG: twin-arginine translocase TatA/TatE family subunit [Candidatus Omnitrophota bacterium]